MFQPPCQYLATNFETAVQWPLLITALPRGTSASGHFDDVGENHSFFATIEGQLTMTKNKRDQYKTI